MKLMRLVISLAIPFIAGGLGSLVTFDAIPTWYAELNKPFFNPPNFVFGPVWTLLYIMQGIALYLFWNAKGKKTQVKTAGFVFFGVQVVLNAMWSFLFFGLKMPELAFGEVIMLWVLIFLTLREFGKFHAWAMYLLIPYLAWVSFASILNLFIVLVN